MASITGEPLSSHHLKELRDESAISPEQIESRGYRTEFNPRNLPAPFTGEQRRPGLLIPIWNVYGECATWQLKPDEPLTDPKTGKARKYLNPTGARLVIDTARTALPCLSDPEAELWITEGAKKVDSAVSHGIPCTIGLLGVSGWKRDGVVLPDWNEIILKGRRVVIAFDSDVMTKASVRRQLDDLGGWLTFRGATVRYCLIPPREGWP